MAILKELSDVMKKINKNIILGTAQFSDNYGMYNCSKPLTEKFQILDKVIHYNCHGIDTALDYDKSQTNIGNWLSKNQYNTKIYSKIKGARDINQMYLSFEKCLKQLKIDKLEGLLFHNQDDWQYDETKILAKNLLKSNKVGSIGLSIYDEYAIPDNRINFLQIPGNLFNQKILKSKKLHKFINGGGLIHVRSIFIQGLLLMDLEKIPSNLKKLYQPLQEFHLLCKKTNHDPITIATNFIKEFLPSFKLVIGVDSPTQFDQIIKKINAEIEPNTLSKAIKIGEKYKDNLWDPRNWK